MSPADQFFAQISQIQALLPKRRGDLTQLQRSAATVTLKLLQAVHSAPSTSDSDYRACSMLLSSVADTLFQVAPVRGVAN